MQITNKHDYFTRHPQWAKAAKELINHGLGLISPKEHDNLVRQKMIKCNGVNDSILAEYPKLIVKTKMGEKTIDLNGNLKLLQIEKQQYESNHQIAYIKWTPKKYSQYIANKSRSWKELEAERTAALVQENF